MSLLVNALSHWGLVPYGPRLARWFIKIITFRKSSLRDRLIYAQVARGYNHIYPSIHYNTFLLGLIISFWFPYTILELDYMHFKMREGTSLSLKIELILKELDIDTEYNKEEYIKEIKDTFKSIGDLQTAYGYKDNYKDNRNNKKKVYKYTTYDILNKTLLIMTFWFTFLYFIALLYSSLVNNLINLFYQFYNACLPYLENEEDKKILSNFSLIKTRDDYISIIENMKEKLIDNDKDLPITYNGFTFI